MVLVRQLQVNSNKGKVFSAGLCSAMVEELFRDVFCVDSCQDISVAIVVENWLVGQLLKVAVAEPWGQFSNQRKANA